jgi:hypothetical protein
MAVIEAPRVQLKNGLCRTIEKTDLSADDGLAITHPSQRQEFHSRGSASAAAGVELKRASEHNSCCAIFGAAYEYVKRSHEVVLKEWQNHFKASRTCGKARQVENGVWPNGSNQTSGSFELDQVGVPPLNLRDFCVVADISRNGTPPMLRVSAWRWVT